MIQPGRAAEKRKANADDGALAFGGVGEANAPIKNAARTPSSNPKIILRAFGRMTKTRPLRTPAAVRVSRERRAGIVGTRVRPNQQCECSADAARLSVKTGPVTHYPSVLYFSHGVANEYYSERSGSRWVRIRQAPCGLRQVRLQQMWATQGRPC
jgi:hypothetical protein